MANRVDSRSRKAVSVICSECQKQGLTSYVYPGISTSTLMWCQPFYDKDGKYHDHDMNSSSTDYSCSNGHKWSSSSGPRECWCGWPNKESP